MPNYVFLRSGTYYFRRVIPLDLRSAFEGRKEIVFSLRTKDRRQAARLGRLEAVKWDELFDARRAARAAGAGSELPQTPLPEVGEVTRRALERLRQEQAEYASRGELPLFRERLAEELAWQQSALDHGPLLWEGQSLEHGLRNAEAGRNAIRALLTGEGAMFVQSAPSPVPPVNVSAAKTPVLSDLVEQWAAERTPTPKTVEMWRRTVALFDRHAGALPVASITKRQVISFKDHLISGGKSRATVANRINQLRALFRYAVELDLIVNDPSAGIRVPADKRASEARVQFDAEALAAVFNGPVHALGARPSRAGGEAAYWLPLLALYTGARLNELGQLRPQDVSEEPYRDAQDQLRSAWVVRFVEDLEAGLTLKTASSQRRIPIHQTLIDLGFLSYVQGMKEAGRQRLFPDLRPDRFGTVTGNWSKWFGSYLRETCGVKDRRLVFHSFRHSFKHYARECGVPKATNDAITGHESGDVGDAYGGLDYPLRPLVEGMMTYRVPGFEVPLPPPAYRA